MECSKGRRETEPPALSCSPAFSEMLLPCLLGLGLLFRRWRAVSEADAVYISSGDTVCAWDGVLSSLRWLQGPENEDSEAFRLGKIRSFHNRIAAAG